MTVNRAPESSCCGNGGCGCGGADPDDLRGRLWKRLQSVRPPWLDRDVVAAGAISALSEDGGRVSVTLDPTDARIGAERSELTGLVRRALDEDEAVTDVRVQWRLPRLDSGPPARVGIEEARPSGGGKRASRPMTPLQAELLDEGVLPEPDALGRSRGDPRAAEAAGYRDGRPSPLPGPPGADSHDRYQGDVPVFQWEIDPLDAERRVGEADVERDGWEHRIWWQVHPRGLAYASIQAMPAPNPSDGAGHPVGRVVAVNLVYDLERDAVVAVYGTAGDFRPFISVFLEAFTEDTGTPEEVPGDAVDDETQDEREETA